MVTRSEAGFDTTEVGLRAAAIIDRLAPALRDLSHRIHANPEVAYQEARAADWCCQLLRDHGFEVTRPVAGLPTAFRARRGSGKPVVCFLAEYDALPGLGHACGHNIIAATALGAGIALARALEDYGVAGATVLVDGTPAEEVGGGKVAMVKAGLYRKVDAVLSMHPETRTAVGGTCLAMASLAVSFRGQASHAAAEPELGVNALDGVLETFSAINALRQHLRTDVRVHGVITHGGTAANIVPDFARAEFRVRAVDMAYFPQVLERVRNCARAAALATGCTLKIAEEPVYETVKDNRTLDRVILETMKGMGLEALDLDQTCVSWSTDFGNVSRVVPASAPVLGIAPAGTPSHHPDFAAAAVSPAGDEAIVTGAKVLAAAGARLVFEADLLVAAWREFSER